MCYWDPTGYKTITAIFWHENMHKYLSVDIICFKKRTVFPKQNSRKTVSFEEQIMSKDKYLCIFSCQMAVIVYVIRTYFYFISWRLLHILSFKAFLLERVGEAVKHQNNSVGTFQRYF